MTNNKSARKVFVNQGKPDLLPTYSMDAQGYRTITLDNVIEIYHRKQVIKFGEES